MTVTEPMALTLDEKAALTSGANFWWTKEAGGVAAVRVSDGPHGLRWTDTDAPSAVARSAPSTCFPPAAGLAQSWDPALAERVGAALGRECRDRNVDVLLGPGINIKRSPLGGRNFEYYSEDPLLTAAMATGWVRGLQAQGVGASLKHFAANNAEHDRMRASSDIDPRALREIYLRAFQQVIQDAAPWTVMCSYNRLNGVLVSQNHFLLTQVLREEWGYDGLVVSDWGAVADRGAAVAAGCDLAMPSPGADSDAELAAAVRAGTVPEADLDRAVARLADLSRKAADGRASWASREPGPGYNVDAHHALAWEAATRSVVLLKNDPVGDRGPVLPLSASESLAVIGAFAATPRYQGGGSSHVTPTRVDSPLEALAAAGAVTYAPGFTVDGSGPDEALVAEAVAVARAADAAVLFLGLDARQESEGFDRTTIDLPAEQVQLAAAVAAVNPRTVAVLSHGGVLRLAPLTAVVPAILDGALLGQAVGSALADVLLGAVNPSGRLAETIPVRIEDTAAFLNFPSEHSHVRYGEGIYVGYRWHDARDLPVEYAFGHGLSYTSFGYSGLSLAAIADGIEARVTVTNTGQRPGREVVQVYAGLPGSSVARPPRVLAGFAPVDLAPGESQEVTITVRQADLAYWDRRVDRFVFEAGTYTVSVGASSRDLRLTGQVTMAGDGLRIPLTLNSTIIETLADPVAGPQVEEAFSTLVDGDEQGAAEALGVDLLSLIGSSPIGRMVSFSGGAVTREQIEQLLAAANAAAE